MVRLRLEETPRRKGACLEGLGWLMVGAHEVSMAARCCFLGNASSPTAECTIVFTCSLSENWETVGVRSALPRWMGAKAESPIISLPGVKGAPFRLYKS